MNDESVSRKLTELFELQKSGALTKEEYESLKSKIINQDESLPEAGKELIKEQVPSQEIEAKVTLTEDQPASPEKEAKVTLTEDQPASPEKEAKVSLSENQPASQEIEAKVSLSENQPASQEIEAKVSLPENQPASSENKVKSGKRPVIIILIAFIVICSAALAIVFLRPGSASRSSDKKNKLTEIQVADADGNSYHTVTIGTQTWMTENLRTTKYNDGSSIPIVTDSSRWAAMSSPAFCWYNNDENTNKNTYGALYNWYTVSTNKLCPSGWHVPADEEWITLTDYLTNNGYGYEGSGDDIAKSIAAAAGWVASDTAGNVGNDQATNNRSGFTASQGGYRFSYGSFLYMGSYGKWWSSTESANNSAFIRFIYSESSIVNSYANQKRNGFSVRCLKDISGQETNVPPDNAPVTESAPSAWDDDYATKIIMSELAKWTEWTFSDSFTSEELNHEVLQFMDYALDSKDLKVGIAYSRLEGHCPPDCDGLISVFEFENKAGWRLNRKAIGFDKLSSEGHLELYKMSASEYGILIRNLFSSGKWGTSKSIGLYAFVNDKLTSTLGWYREDLDTVFSAKVSKAIRDGQSYVMIEEKAKPDESDTIVTQTVYKFNGTEYEEFTGYLTDPSLTSISRFYDINTAKERDNDICPTCHGTGVQICTLCGGSGVDNMGMECGCIRAYKVEIAAGHTPSHQPLQWTCISCRGTGTYSR